MLKRQLRKIRQLMLLLLINVIALPVTAQNLQGPDNFGITRPTPLMQKIQQLEQDYKQLRTAWGEALNSNSISLYGLSAVETEMHVTYDYIQLLKSREGADLFEKRSHIEKISGYQYGSNGKSINQSLAEFKAASGDPEFDKLQVQLITTQAKIEKQFLESSDVNIEELSASALQLKKQLTKLNAQSGGKLIIPNQGLVLISGDQQLPSYWFTGNIATDRSNYSSAGRRSARKSDVADPAMESDEIRNTRN